MKKSKNLTYQQALDELVQIQTNIENNQVPIDELAVVVKRATDLLAYCKDTLRNIETTITDTLKKTT